MGFDGFNTLDVLKMVTLLLVATSVSIAGLARARGENALFWGGVCAFGFLLMPTLVAFVVVPMFVEPAAARELRPFWFFVSVVVWVTFLVVWIRFLVGRKRVHPKGMWSCPHCNYLKPRICTDLRSLRAPIYKIVPHLVGERLHPQST